MHLEQVKLSELKASPIGRCARTPSCLIWCASPELAGWYAWGGNPEPDELDAILDAATSYLQLAPRFDCVLDTREISLIGPRSLTTLLAWVMHHRVGLKARVRTQASVIRRDAIGLVFAGIMPALGDAHPVRVYTDPDEAFREVAGDFGVEVCAEIDRIVEATRDLPHELQIVRKLLAEDLAVTIEEAARQLGTSPRSLQRILKHAKTSFSDEVTNARFAEARRRLADPNAKVLAVAAALGWSERTLTIVFRQKLGLTPTEWRKRNALIPPAGS
ncbi:MAG TPA: AraC family transcriptional regulator [Polyangiaceae bacterium]